MADLEALKSVEDLKWEYLFDQFKPTPRPMMHYDDLADMLMILFGSPTQETVVFYVDNYVGLLVDPETMNVVGFQVEAVQRSFLPAHPAVSRIWRLSESGFPLKEIKDYGDLILNFERNNKVITREVIRTTEGALGEPAIELVAALA